MTLRTTRALVAILALGAGAARADQTVTFNIQLNLTKLDAQVTAVGLHCTISTLDKSTSVANSAAIPPNPQPVSAAGSFSGTLSVPVTVASAKISQAKNWYCAAMVRGPNSQWATLGATGAPAWALKAVGAGNYYVEGAL